MKKLTNEERQQLEKMHQDALEKKKRHPKVNHPGSVDQMEEVWEKVDRLEAEQFTPKSFFKLHDINSDGYIDEAELEAIMLKEVRRRNFLNKKFDCVFLILFRRKKFTKECQKLIPLKNKKKWIVCDNM